MLVSCFRIHAEPRTGGGQSFLSYSTSYATHDHFNTTFLLVYCSEILRVTLCPLQLFAKTIRNFLLKQTNLSRSGSNCIGLDALEKIYLAGMKNGSIPDELLRLGYASLTSLLQVIRV